MAQSLDALSNGLALAETEKLTPFVSEFEILLQGQMA
jgi:hypothetical protein